MITIDNRDPRPLYEQVISNLKQLIVSGVLTPDDKLPSVRSLATELAINPNTIQRAYRELEAAGYTYSVAGKGSFVATTAETARLHQQELLDRFDAVVAQWDAYGFDRKELVNRLQGGASND